MALEVIVLAAGQGSRMRSRFPKVLQKLAGRPLLQHVLDTAAALAPSRIHVVVGHGADAVREAFADRGLNWVDQSERLGTGHAVLQAMPAVDTAATVLVLYGDVPLVAEDTLRSLLAMAASGPALLTASLDNPAGYGRILRNANGQFSAVVEDRDASPEQRALREVNTGILAAPAAQLAQLLPLVGNDNQQGEYYLPDILTLALERNIAVHTAGVGHLLEVQGVNDPFQLAQLERALQLQQAEALMQAGVRLADPARIDVRGALRCGRDVSIDVNCVFIGEVELADGVSVGPNCVLEDCRVGADSQVLAMSHLEGAEVGTGCSVGPFARLRPGTRMSDSARVGNFVETKKTRIGTGSKVNHLTYLGDCDVGEEANIGAGTITCNYDGVNKHPTRIGDGAFVGSNATLVAPLEIGDNGFVAAGSTITRNVSSDELAVGRGKQRNIPGWKRPGSDKEG
ncbi:MAG: UDP-N-acetylglucosamine diphosphorylase/glucosamine-1-phosphate N-acetyltransferase [Haliea sp.]|nr:UDP-N-acetylglucosamine diphosphorylase/glucosamine-1-phosphate N-acetyltransferase [Haliea sp.]|tara:strand:+ start:6557 stop:7924 length:1368 start_codon:yes stop_codon:yes gene_type:complete